MKKILLILCALFISSAHADVLETCIEKIAKDNTIWQNMLFDKTNGIFNDLPESSDLTDEIVDSKKQSIYALIGKDIELKCPEKLAAIAKKDRAVIPFTHNEKEYAFDFSIETMFDYVNDIRTGIIVVNKRNLSSGKVLKVSDFPKKQKIFSDECSDWTIFENLDDDGAVNIAGQAVFNEFGGSKNEFFLDFTEGDDRRVFPGLVLMDETGSRTEKIVSYRNVKTGMQKMRQFAEKLKGSACSNQGLAVYLVALDVQHDSTSKLPGHWSIGLLSTGGAAGATAIFLTATAATVGWIASGVLLAAGAVVALIPSPIEKIDQVMILDGPYNL